MSVPVLAIALTATYLWIGVDLALDPAARRSLAHAGGRLRRAVMLAACGMAWPVVVLVAVLLVVRVPGCRKAPFVLAASLLVVAAFSTLVATFCAWRMGV